jgi:hypothetical protein
MSCLKFTLFFVTIFLIYGCIFKDIEKKSTISLVEFYSDLQLVKVDNGETTNLKNSIVIYKDANYVVYKGGNRFVNSKSEVDRDGRQISEKITLDTIKSYYIVYHIKNSYGYLYDSINTIKPLRISIDSFQRVKLFKDFPFYTANDIVKASEKNNTVPYLIEKTAPKDKPDDTYPDSSYYYYTKGFKNAAYTFSKQMDSARNMKLYKVRLIYVPIKKGGKYDFDVPRREFNFELRKAKPAPEIPKLIERFKAMEANLK